MRNHLRFRLIRNRSNFNRLFNTNRLGFCGRSFRSILYRARILADQFILFMDIRNNVKFISIIRS